jgi:predicted glycosyltransferase
MPKVLVAPLDWGLGHATRCIPIIRELVVLGCEVTIAASGQTEVLLRTEFPNLRFMQLRGYQIRYGKCGVLFSLLRQLPRILRTIKYEQKWLAKLLKKEKFDAIISDNRPGLFHDSIYSVYITHQLQIQSGIGSLADRLLYGLHKQYYRRFSEVWVPDFETSPGLAGKLSHPKQHSRNVIYIGPLTRLQKENASSLKYDLMILFSGPEPQRSIFEHEIMEQLHQYNEKVLLVRGLPGTEPKPTHLPKNIEIENHLSAIALSSAIAASSIIICRSGYTTIMDLICLQKKAVLIPTPGQTEQEYLARHLEEHGVFPYIRQFEFDLKEAINRSRNFSFNHPEYEKQFQNYQKVIRSWLEKINAMQD